MGLIKQLIGTEAFEQRIVDYWEETPEDSSYLICQLGQREKADFTAFVVAHADTVKPSTDWNSPHVLTAQADDLDRLRGLGVYDMQSSVMNGIHLLREVNVPEGMCLYVAFTGDEEYRSHAAQHIINQWPHFSSIDLVLSSEIGPLQVPPGQDEMNVIGGRRGILKSGIHAKLVMGAGHGARPNMPSAYHELAQVYRIFNPDALDPLSPALRAAAPHLRHHPILAGDEGSVPGPLGFEEIFAADVSADSEGLIRPQSAKTNYKMLLVPPSTIESALKVQMEAVERLGVIRDWKRTGISVSLSKRPDSTSYSPFMVDPKHPYVGVINAAIERITGASANYVYGHSNADECLYAAQGGKPTLSIPIKGGGAHSPLEWVSAADIARNYIVFRYLIQRCFELFRRAKRSI